MRKNSGNGKLNHTLDNNKEINQPNVVYNPLPQSNVAYSPAQVTYRY